MNAKKVIKNIFLLGIIPLFLFSCNDQKPGPSPEPEPEPEPVPPEYERDKDNFTILPDDYFSYEDDPTDTKLKNKVYFAPTVDEVDQYERVRMYVAGRQFPVYAVKINPAHIYTSEELSRVNNGVTSFCLEGQVEIALHVNFSLNKGVTISPLELDVPYHIDYNARVLRFTISTHGQYVVNFGSNRSVMVFANSFETLDKPTGSNVMYFGPGVHNHQNDKRINSYGEITLNSNDIVYIDLGAFVRARFISNRASNITFVGPGYVDGSQFKRTVNPGEAHVPIDFNWCTNITIKDVAFLDPAGWCLNLYFDKDITIDNIKIISSRHNGDGISLQSCQNATTTNSFVRSWDDSLVVKNYPDWNNRSIEGTTKNIKFDNVLIWTDLAQSMEVGYECVGQVMEDIIFSNITVIQNYHLAVLSIHNGNNADIKRVKFENITIENISYGNQSNKVLDFSVAFSSTWSSQHKVTALGSVDGVNVSNVLLLKGIDHPHINIKGSMETRSGYPNVPHYVSNVTVEDFSIYGETLTSQYGYIEKEYVQNISFTKTGKDITGHIISRDDISQYGHNIIVVE